MAEGLWGRFLSRIVQDAGLGEFFLLLQECGRRNLIRSLFGPEGNYTTYLEHRKGADELFMKEAANGFAEWNENKSHWRSCMGSWSNRALE